mgnify:CR=1 FL=1
MNGINKVIIVGNVGKDPEIKTYNGNVKYAQFSVATTEQFKDKNSNEKKTFTEWHTIKCWRNLADVAENYVKKGRQVYIEGKIHYSSWDENGVKKQGVEIVPDILLLLNNTQQ